MISNEDLVRIDAALETCGELRMSPKEERWLDHSKEQVNNDCDIYRLAQKIIMQRDKDRTRTSDSLYHIVDLANANSCTLDSIKPEKEETVVPMFGGGLFTATSESENRDDDGNIYLAEEGDRQVARVIRQGDIEVIRMQEITAINEDLKDQAWRSAEDANISEINAENSATLSSENAAKTANDLSLTTQYKEAAAQSAQNSENSNLASAQNAQKTELDKQAAFGYKNEAEAARDLSLQYKNEAASSAEEAAISADKNTYQGLWPNSGGSAEKGNIWQTQVGGVPTGEYFTALQDNATTPSNDDTNWRAINDHSSLNNRNQPSAHDAASISRGASNVDYDISALERFNDDIEYKALLSPCKNIVFDMQRDALKSQGAVSGEPLTTVEWAVASSAAIGDTTINIGANTLVTGQLIGYVADDGEYYSSRVKQAGSTITLHDPIEANVNAGNEVFTFYKDKSHPSVKGYRAIADYMLRQKIYQNISNDIGALTYSKLTGSEVISTLSDDNFLNCGSSEHPSTRVQTSAQNSGFYTSSVRLSCGDAGIELVINTNGSDVRFRVGEADDIAQFIVDRTINTELPTKIVIPIRKKLDSQLTIRAEQLGAGSADFNFIMKFLSGSSVKIESMNGGTHVLHGDSWFFQEGIYERLQERLPNANIINNGVGGRTSTNLAQTIYSEVKGLKPDYVWCMAGTNDAILGVSTSGYHRWMNQAIADIKNIGATPIIFTPAAGNLIDNWLSRSRAYLYSYDFRDGEETQYEDLLISFSGVKVPANSDVFCGSAGRTEDSVRVIEAFGSGVNNILFGYSTGMATPNIDVQSRAGNSIINTVNVAKSDSNARFFNVGCENTTASEQEANGFVRIRIKSSVK